MDQTREDRMRSRMRGAARHQVADADFGNLFSFPIVAPEPEPETGTESSDPPVATSPAPTPAPPTAKRTGPNTSAKRRRLDSERIAVLPQSQPSIQPPPAQPSPAQSSSANRSSRRLSRVPANNDPYDLENAPYTVAENEETAGSTPTSRTSTLRTARMGRTGSSAGPKSAARNGSPQQSSPLPALRAEEVSESPADAPGSGHRRRVRASGARDSSVLLQSALRSADNDTAAGFAQSSSPLSRMSRRSTAGNLASARSARTGLRRSARVSSSPDDKINELSSDLPAIVEENNGSIVSAEDSLQEENILEIAETVVDESVADALTETKEQQEIAHIEAPSRIGRGRPPPRIPAGSPELISDDVAEEPSIKRPQREPPPKKKSPAKQRQPKAPRAKQDKPRPARKRRGVEDTEPPVGINIQRFTKRKRDGGGESDDEDILNSNIPHANRSGVNCIDVLAQLCEEIIGATLEKVKEALKEAQDAPTRKELRIKVTALEAFREELRTRLLEHTIALDTLYALKKRVREAQKEKLKLRERIVQIRVEREQVALRMDAVRIKHDEDSKDALHKINLSAAMHDVDLAIEQGRAAPELPTKDQKTADLGNLELLISRVSEQVCSSSSTGGTLKQIQIFNAFLERAVAVL